jgi:hypothetical protein
MDEPRELRRTTTSDIDTAAAVKQHDELLTTVGE